MLPELSQSGSVSNFHVGKPWPIGSTITETGVNFSVAAPEAKQVELLIFATAQDSEAKEIINIPETNRSGDYWHVEVEGLKEGSFYGYRVSGQQNAGPKNFSSTNVLLDPCARAISGWATYTRDKAKSGEANPEGFLKSVVCEREHFDFTSHPRPRHPWHQSVIYELHVGGFTRDAASGVSDNYKGTFLGLIQKLPYLKDLGITAIELLPIFSFDPCDAPAGQKNYWGYSPLNWFTPHHEYIVDQDPLEARKQFRTLVEACHDNDIEVIIDVVYNHTTEGGPHGPSLSWRGLGEKLYYHQNSQGEYLDVSGCGNTIAANRPLVRQLILESMRCWAKELGIDGFRFDLGVALTRGEGLTPLEQPPLFEEIESDPGLSDLKLISEPWDCGGLYKLGDFPAKGVSTWNGHFRDDLRSFWKGESDTVWKLKERLNGSQDLYKSKSNKIESSLNFVTSHDGFTLNDLVSFNFKHNLANGEDNRDGENHNRSWNHGTEGPTTDSFIKKLRGRQQRNLLASLLLSPGVPMLAMGDEVSRSQGGNNNAWCQDNRLGWMIWEPSNCDRDLHLYVKKLLLIRKQLKELFSPEYIHKEASPLNKTDDQSLWLKWHGVEVNKPDFGDWSHAISYSLNRGLQGSIMWIGFNACEKEMLFEIPKPTSTWNCMLNTSNQSPLELSTEPIAWPKNSIKMESRSLVVMLNCEYASLIKLQ